MTGSAATAAQVTTDLEHGGRWTSLRLGGREWLWSRDEPLRPTAAPGDPFRDAGGLEECIPTVRGRPDHGRAWSRAWRPDADAATVDCDDFWLHRRITCADDAVTADYRLEAAPGYRFIWAAHALLDLSLDARVELADGTPVRIYAGAADEAAFVPGCWPDRGGLDLDRLGPDDGSAVGVIALDTATVAVTDRGQRLELRLDAGAQLPAVAPTSVAIWRNRGGFPADRPYRSIGIEPMLGAVFDLAHAGPDDAATVPASGVLQWRLRISCARPAA